MSDAPPPEEPPADPRDALIRGQAQVIAAQAERITALEAVVAELREQLAAAERAGSRNSGNSSMPPSSDGLPGRKPPRKQRRAAERAEKKRRGKQPGSPGASMTWEVPDRTEDHFPQGACACGRALADAADLGIARSYQQEEIPAAPAERVQHDLHEVRCACGRPHVAARPAGVPDSALSIGPRLRALAVYLVVFQHVPVERCRQLIADVTGAAVSDGFIHSCLAKAATLAAEVVTLIRTLITAAPVAGFDETTLRSGAAGEKKYVHGAFTEEYSAFWLGARSLEAMEDAGVLPGFAGIVVSDRYQNYFSARWEHVTGNQPCLSHLLRDYEDCAETYPGAVWPGQAQRALRGMIHAWHAAVEQGLVAIPAGVLESLAHEFRHAVLAGLASVPRVPGPKNAVKQKPGRELLEFCKDRQGDVLRFTTNTGIWPTNNISERGVRPLKTQQKISGRLASDDVTQDRLDIRSYIDTARKHGKNAMDVLHDLMLGRPWRPPAQAFSP
ncbi:MAG TPA: IS66 family transposase [Streptosporangiaceae bacterium]|nr:IS66 family transposase [Streptosporangiaceae bacterium]